ncbi:hypothetical protein VCHA53O466_140145 [Vibrio chagasii]|nr:hypothetical protein VCHA53O466_140145 [Vibrio chagasii]
MAITKYKKGFYLIEAVFASMLVGSGLLVSRTLKDAEHKSDMEDMIAGSVLDVLYGADRRVLVDGHKREEGGWDMKLDGVRSVMQDFVLPELIATGNAECGKADGWTPRATANSGIALVPCDVLPVSGLPLGFSVSVESMGHELDQSHLDKVILSLYHNEVDDFYSNFNSYLSLVSKMERRKGYRVTGDYRFWLSNHANYEQISTDDCYAIGASCRINASFDTNPSTLDIDDFLRVDGSNFMSTGLKVRVDTDSPARCFHHDTLEPVHCGFEVTDDEVELAINQLNTGDVFAYREGVGVPVSCQKSDEASRCGFQVVMGEDSPISHLAANRLRLDNEYKGWTSNGTGGYTEVVHIADGHLNVASDLNVDSLFVEKNLVAKSGITGKGDDGESVLLEVRGDSNITDGVTVNENMLVNHQSMAVHGDLDLDSSCASGDLTTSSNGVLFRCSGGKWTEPDYPSGAVLPFTTISCPQGWTSYGVDAGHRLHQVREGGQTGNLSGRGDAFKGNLKLEHMPAHRHQAQIYDYTNALSGRRSRRRVRFNDSGGTATFTNNAHLGVMFRAQTYTVNYCRKH